MLTKKSMNLRLFIVKEATVFHTDGRITINNTLKVAGSGQEYFGARFLGDSRQNLTARLG